MQVAERVRTILELEQRGFEEKWVQEFSIAALRSCCERVRARAIPKADVAGREPLQRALIAEPGVEEYI